jgi:ADP-ribosyl-[dinitrogen reductase] hydrolase
MSIMERARGMLLGLAVGDAVGTTVEFSAPGTFAPVTDMVGGGPFHLPAGAWTDDTSMALCLAESLVERGWDPVDQLERYLRWYREGYRSSIGRCFDIGNATRAALERFERTREPFPGDAAPNAAGNGPLMKLAPVVLAYAERPEDAVRYAGESARTTHGSPLAVEACETFARLLLDALHGRTPPLAWREPVRGTGYILESLNAAQWAVDTTASFEAAILAAVNLGDDADTTGAVYGQLAGAYYGAEGIPAGWRARLTLANQIEEFADQLYRLAGRPAHGK